MIGTTTKSISMGTMATAVALLLVSIAWSVDSFSVSRHGTRTSNGSLRTTALLAMDASNLMASDANNLDRFKSVCLVGTDGKSAVDQFDADLYASLEAAAEEDDLWVAVYRSNNNQPSVVVRDDFFRAMNDATTKGGSDDDEDGEEPTTPTVSTVSNTASFLSDTLPSLLEVPSTKPVAIARLTKSIDLSKDTKTVYLLDNLRCSLKKEDQDPSCDGGSEFVEALSVAVDTLLLKHLQRLLHDRDDATDAREDNAIFEGTVRTKATLFSGKLFEQRGFTEVETLSRDMATHVSSYEACFENYADRTIEATMAAGTRDRALQIVALLGRLDPELQAKERESSGGSGGDDDDGYDPWANMQLYRS